MSGTWTSHTSDKAIGGSYANLNSKGEAQISFKSTGIAWIGRRNAYSGIATVYLDGLQDQGTVDLYFATTKYEQAPLPDHRAEEHHPHAENRPHRDQERQIR